MLTLSRHTWGTLAMFAFLTPCTAPAQTRSQSFEDLQRTLKKGQTVSITDDTGRETKGKVAEVSADSLTLGTSVKRSFARETITTVRRTDSLKNGALIGAGIGAGFAMWDYLIDPSEPGNAAVFAVAIGLGTAIGAGIDALVGKGGRVLYQSRPLAPGLTIAPFVGRHRHGVRAAIRF